MKIFISGKITGLREADVLEKFEKAEQELREAGWEPVNPAKLGIPFNAPRQKSMPKRIEALNGCQAIYMLNDWRDSVGARVELSIARHDKKDMYYEEYHSLPVMETIKNEVL